MVNAVTDEFWKMVQEAIDDQVLHFKSEDSSVWLVIHSLPLSSRRICFTLKFVPSL